MLPERFSCGRESIFIKKLLRNKIKTRNNDEIAHLKD